MALHFQLPLLKVPSRYVTPACAPEADYSELDALPPLAPPGPRPHCRILAQKANSPQLQRIQDNFRREVAKYEACEAEYIAERARRDIWRIEIQEEHDAAFWEAEDDKRVELETRIAQFERMNRTRLLMAFALTELHRLENERRATGDFDSLGDDIDRILQILDAHQVSDVDQDLAAMPPRYQAVSLPELPGPSDYVAPTCVPEPDYTELDALPALVPVEPASAPVIPVGVGRHEAQRCITKHKQQEADRYTRETAYFTEQHRRAMLRIELQEEQNTAFWREEEKRRVELQAQRVRSAREFIPSSLVELPFFKMVQECSDLARPLSHVFHPNSQAADSRGVTNVLTSSAGSPAITSSAAGSNNSSRPSLKRAARSSPDTRARKRTRTAAMSEAAYDAIFSGKMAEVLGAKKDIALKLGPGCAACAETHPCISLDEKRRTVSTSCLWCSEKKLPCAMGVVPIRYHASTAPFIQYHNNKISTPAA
ncbi:hypothetical protein MSAN_00733000 [Mycena sanguinolenta]|uniref:Uncharacterized protein n=1 Tax=Mycena sanguinolenta TaxID=230812 RepID=A0A8H6Z2D5_9AGAR|nr:hypothetical protein MSAN_00733000 [Mycena sanguinolenta]